MKNIKKQLHVVHDHIITHAILIGLALLSGVLLIYELSYESLLETVPWIHTVDFFIAMAFLTDFLIGLYIAEKKGLYFRKNWIDLIASIPVSGALFQSLRVLRLIRVVRIIARINKLQEHAEHIQRHGSRYIYVSTITFVIIVTSAAYFYNAEQGINPQVATYFDAIWWTMSTASTVGYGDIHPMTTEGRIIGMFLMVFGIGLVGAVAGIVSNLLIKK